MEGIDLLRKLADVYQAQPIEFPLLRPVTMAQWMLESGKGTSALAVKHNNFGGLKWRDEMRPYATKVNEKAHDGYADYCKFAKPEDFIRGYWAFMDRSPYAGWRKHAATGEQYLRFIAPIYDPSNKSYVAQTMALVPQAEALLGGAALLAAGSALVTSIGKVGWPLGLLVAAGIGGYQAYYDVGFGGWIRDKLGFASVSSLVVYPEPYYLVHIDSVLLPPLQTAPLRGDRSDWVWVKSSNVDSVVMSSKWRIYTLGQLPTGEFRVTFLGTNQTIAREDRASRTGPFRTSRELCPAFAARKIKLTPDRARQLGCP